MYKQCKHKTLNYQVWGTARLYFGPLNLFLIFINDIKCLNQFKNILGMDDDTLSTCRPMLWILLNQTV